MISIPFLQAIRINLMGILLKEYQRWNFCSKKDLGLENLQDFLVFEFMVKVKKAVILYCYSQSEEIEDIH